MKKIALSALLLLVLAQGLALANTGILFVRDSGRLLDVAALISEGTDIQASYGLDHSYCYRGGHQAAMGVIRKLNQAGDFFSGGGGGFELKSVTLIRGFATYDIKLVLKDEVVPDETRTMLVKPCR